MNCKCGVAHCGDRDCEYCESIEVVGLCPPCHKLKGETCRGCKKHIDITDEDNFLRTVGWEYFCNLFCYNNWINKEVKK